LAAALAEFADSATGAPLGFHGLLGAELGAGDGRHSTRSQPSQHAHAGQPCGNQPFYEIVELLPVHPIISPYRDEALPAAAIGHLGEGLANEQRTDIDEMERFCLVQREYFPVMQMD